MAAGAVRARPRKIEPTTAQAEIFIPRPQNIESRRIRQTEDPRSCLTNRPVFNFLGLFRQFFDEHPIYLTQMEVRQCFDESDLWVRNIAYSSIYWRTSTFKRKRADSSNMSLSIIYKHHIYVPTDNPFYSRRENNLIQEFFSLIWSLCGKKVNMIKTKVGFVNCAAKLPFKRKIGRHLKTCPQRDKFLEACAKSGKKNTDDFVSLISWFYID